MKGLSEYLIGESVAHGKIRKTVPMPISTSGPDFCDIVEACASNCVKDDSSCKFKEMVCASREDNMCHWKTETPSNRRIVYLVFPDPVMYSFSFGDAGLHTVIEYARFYPDGSLDFSGAKSRTWYTRDKKGFLEKLCSVMSRIGLAMTGS